MYVYMYIHVMISWWKYYQYPTDNPVYTFFLLKSSLDPVKTLIVDGEISMIAGEITILDG